MPIRLHRDELPAINLTSMIDVLFLLIIFFMVGSHFGEPEQKVTVELPRASANGSVTSGITKTVNILRDGSTVYEGQRVSLDQLTLALKTVRSQSASLSVDLRFDGEAKAEQFVPVCVALSNAGVRINMNYVSGTRR